MQVQVRRQIVALVDGYQHHVAGRHKLSSRYALCKLVATVNAVRRVLASASQTV